MKQSILLVIICMLASVANGNENFYMGRFVGVGVRTQSAQSLNNALKSEGLAKIDPIVATFNIGATGVKDAFVFNWNLNSFASHNKDNVNLTFLRGWGVSLDFGRQIWGNDKMSLYPYFGLSYMQSFLKTQQTTNANSFGAVYQQQLVERSFTNNGELDAALGLAYRVKLGKRDMLEIGGGYHFPLLRSKWRYIDEKIDFPKLDCRGWVIGITWIKYRTKKSTDSK